MRHGEEQGSGGIGQVGRESEVSREGSGGAGEREERRTPSEEDPMTRSWVEVPLTKGKVAKIDRADMLIIGRWKWMIKPVGAGFEYAARGGRRSDGKRGMIFMHRWIMEPPPGMVVDHINHDKLDNRRSNLRICTRQQNSAHRQKVTTGVSGFRGVSRCGSKWKAEIHISYRNKHLGVFADALSAALAYDRAARTVYGVFATLNFPNEATPDASI